MNLETFHKIDQLVAEKIFGYELLDLGNLEYLAFGVQRQGNTLFPKFYPPKNVTTPTVEPKLTAQDIKDGRIGEIPPFSLDINYAWLVVKKLEKDGKRLRLEQKETGIWEADFGASQKHGKTPPLAICLSALKRLGIDVNLAS